MLNDIRKFSVILRAATKSLMAGPKENLKFCFLSIFTVTQNGAEGHIALEK